MVHHRQDRLRPAACDSTLSPQTINCPFRLVSSLPTSHSANIFSAMFMPLTANSVIASAAGDGRVRIFDVHWSLGSASPKPRSTLACFTDRAKRLALEPGNPHLLWACSEDGTVHQYDLRQRHECTRDGSCMPFIRFGQSLNCVTM
ncbi:hypothetical protein BC831DRAFT_479306, partial [Entophlyctis helioformis]